MELQRRLPSHRPFPTWRKLSLSGLGQSNINPTTIWTPQTGYLNTPGTLADGYQLQPQVFSVYDVPGLLLPYESCIDEMGGTAGSTACVDRNLAVEQENFRRTAQYNAGLPVSGVTRASGIAPATSTGGRGGSSVVPSFAFTNLTSGDNTNFKVGDRWQILVTGPPNSPVSFNGGRNGENRVYPMGSTDGSGRFTLNGQMGAGEIGNWAEAWRVANQIVASFSFRVLPASSSAGATTFTAGNTGGGQSKQTTQPPISKSVFDTLPGGSISIGGNDIPVWALGAAAVVAFLMFRGR